MSNQPSYRPGTSTSSLAVVSLVFGILAWCLLPLIGAIVAIICGHLARGEIRRSPPESRPEGDGMAVAGLVLGYAQLALCVVGILLLIAVVMFGFAIAGWH
ncbi:MAG TPA: DUF4190 domain-containing protein [Rhodanobacter sp.]